MKLIAAVLFIAFLVPASGFAQNPPEKFYDFRDLEFQGGRIILPDAYIQPNTPKFKRLISLKKSFLDNTRDSVKSSALNK